MTTLTKILIGLGAFAVVIVGIGVAIFLSTNTLTKQADAFFADVDAGRMDEAYARVTPSAQQTQTKESLLAFLTQNDLDHVKKTSWSSRSFDGNVGHVKGTVETAAGVSHELEIGLLKTNGTWHISSINLATLTGSESTGSATLPSVDELTPPTELIIGLFVTSIQQKDFTSFYGQIADVWKKEVSIKDLEEGFADFLKLDKPFSADAEPLVIEDRTEGRDDAVIVKGYKTFGDERIAFEIPFIKENGTWKAAAFSADYLTRE